jgi:co-chaperonin GroES (HSP10)
MKITPLGTNILLERLEAPHDNPEATDSPLLTVSEDNQDFIVARVVATGPGFRRKDGSYTPTGVTAGDQCAVLLGAWVSGPMADGSIGRLRLIKTRDIQWVQE